jgi:hypothetical protein
MRSACVVKAEVTRERCAGLGPVRVPVQDFLVLDAAPQPFDEHVVVQRPLPSMLMLTPAASSTSIHSSLRPLLACQGRGLP